MELEVFLGWWVWLNNQDPLHSLQQFVKIDGQNRLCDLQKSRWSKLLRFFIIYSALKSVTISALIIYVDYFHRRGELWVNKLRIWAPDPLSDVQVFMPIVCMGVPMVLFMTVIFWQDSLLDCPMYLQTTRFILNPELERKRLNLMIENSINNLIASATCARLNSVMELRRGWQFKRFFKSDDGAYQGHKIGQRINQDWCSTSFTIKQLIKAKRNDKHLVLFRPHIYSTEWLRSSRIRAKNCLTFLFAYTYTDVFLVIGSVFYLAMLNRCKRLQLDSCINPLKVFTWMELIYLFEIFLITLLYCGSFVHIAFQLYLSLVNQIQLIKNFRLELEKCVLHLRYFNSRLYSTEGSLVHKILQEILIKERVLVEDVRGGARVLSSLLGLIMTITMILLVTFLVGLKLAGAKGILETDFATTIILLSVWVILNLLATITAYVNSRLFGALKLYWPIKSELIHYANREQIRRTNINYLASQWHRLAFYLTDTEANEYAVCPFGLDLTFNEVIEYNFYIISTYSFLFKLN